MDDELVARHTSAEVAAILAKPASTIRHAASQHSIGTLFGDRLRLFSDADIDRLKEVFKVGRGRPRKPSAE